MTNKFKLCNVAVYTKPALNKLLVCTDKPCVGINILEQFKRYTNSTTLFSKSGMTVIPL